MLAALNGLPEPCAGFAKRANAEFLEVFVGELPKHSRVNLVLSEGCSVLTKAGYSQPSYDLHNGVHEPKLARYRPRQVSVRSVLNLSAGARRRPRALNNQHNLRGGCPVRRKSRPTAGKAYRVGIIFLTAPASCGHFWSNVSNELAGCVGGSPEKRELRMPLKLTRRSAGRLGKCRSAKASGTARYS